MGFDFSPFASSRREYGHESLDESELLDSPLAQFDRWLVEALSQDMLDPTAMVLSTVDSKGYPNSRVVLLKGVEDGTFVFYTNYESTKAHELESTTHVALNFYWPVMARQVRIRGSVRRVSRRMSEAYFSSRSKMSQCSAIVSPQSRVVSDRATWVKKAEQLLKKQGSEALPCPVYWGGYAVLPDEIEFWQGRDHRLHDRIQYTKNKSGWDKKRLAS